MNYYFHYVPLNFPTVSAQSSNIGHLSCGGFSCPVIAADRRSGSLTPRWPAAKSIREKFPLELGHVDQCRQPAVIMGKGTRKTCHGRPFH